MLKIRSKMLKIKKNNKIIKLGKISRTPGVSRIFKKFLGNLEKFLEKFSFPGKLKIWEKENPY